MDELQLVCLQQALELSRLNESKLIERLARIDKLAKVLSLEDVIGHDRESVSEDLRRFTAVASLRLELAEADSERRALIVIVDAQRVQLAAYDEECRKL